MLMLTIDKISDSVIRLDDGITPVETHAIYRARVEKGLLILAPLSGPGKTFAADLRIVRVNGQTFDSPDSLLNALSFIGNFNAGGGTPESTLPPFEAGKFYYANQAIVYDGAIYTAIADFTAGAVFAPADWNRVSVGDAELDEKVDKTDAHDQLYGTDDEGEQTAFDKSDFELTDNKIDEIRDIEDATDTNYPTELAVRTQLDALAEAVGGVIGDLTAITNSTDASTVVAALNSLFKMINGDISVEIKNDGLYISRDSGGTVTEDRLVELTDLEPLEQEIQGLHGKTARLNAYDFGMGITSENINDPDIQTMLNAYALVQLGLSDVADIPNFIGVHNLYTGAGGNHLLIFNQAITGSGTPDDPEFPAHWIDNGLDSVSIASTTSLGVVKGSVTDMEISVSTDGIMSVNGLSTALGGKVDETTLAGKVYGTDADGKQTTFNKDDFGKVDTVNSIAPDAYKNVQTDYVYATEAAFEAAKANIPIGATVIKLYEYPDNIAGFMIVPDYANTGTTNLLPQGIADAYNQVYTLENTYTLPQSGFVYCRLMIYLNAMPITRTCIGQIYINDALVNNFETNDGTNGSERRMCSGVYPVKAGDVVRTKIYKNVPTETWPGTTYLRNYLYFIPPLFVKKELPVIVEKNGSYSLDEIKTSDMWIDGKPIYKKTYAGTWGATGSVAKTLETDFIGNYSIDEIIEYKGAAKGYYTNAPINSTYRVDWANIGYGADVNNDNLRVFAGGVSAATDKWHLTVYYTKTTD
jgi:hypothetical protein